MRIILMNKKTKPIDPQEAVDFLIEQSKPYAKAKSERIYMEEYRKTLKAQLMIEAERMGHKTAVMQEREAYSSPEYEAHLQALKEAVEHEERLRWMMIAAQERIAVWRSQEASNRSIDKLTV
jgi:hypothetical protein